MALWVMVINKATATATANVEMPWAYMRDTQPTGIDWHTVFVVIRDYLARFVA